MARSKINLSRRLRALADRVEEVPPLPAMEREMTQVLGRWEQALTSKPEDAAMRAPADAPAAGVIRIWSDGSCAPNPGPGGWAAIIERDGVREELSGSAASSTNNIMEMTAAIEALKRTPAGARMHVTTDSRYLMDGVTRWLSGWKRKGWRKADGNPVLNQSLWQTLDALVVGRRLTWSWVRGHAGHDENERCDQLANEARAQQAPTRHHRG